MTTQPLRVALVDGDPYTPLYETLNTFSEQTGRPVEVAVREPLAELLPRLHTELAAGIPYDLISGHSHYTAGLAPLLLPLDELISPGEIASFALLAAETCRWDGALLQLPRSVEARLLYYRSEIFDDRRERAWFAEASDGRELRVPQSWDELAAIAQYFTRSGKLFGFAFPGVGGGLVATFAEILTSLGGTFFDESGEPGFYSRAGEWSLTLLRDLYGRWEAVPPEILEYREEDVTEAFRMGRVAMACDTTGVARLLCDPTFSAVAGWHSVALLPGGTGGRRASWAGCPTLAIPRTSAEPAAAVELLRFLTSAESQKLEAKHGAIPSRTAAYASVREDLRPGTLGHLRFTLAEQTLRLGLLAPPRLPDWWEIEQRLWPLLQEAVSGDREPEEALRLAREACSPRRDEPARTGDTESEEGAGDCHPEQREGSR
ncbi:MAG: extracellular solute-binding protein [Actinomycetota bacterium]